MKRFIILGMIAIGLTAFLARPSSLSSANLTNVKDTLQTSRLSNRARIDSTGTTVGSSTVTILSSAVAPATTVSTANLRAGDSILINTNSYTVVGILSSTAFTVTPVVQAGDADNGDPVYLKVKPQHVVTFSTATAVANGFFQVLLPSDPDGSANDGNPDDQGYDFGGGTVDVVSSDIGAYDFVTGVATAAGAAGCTAPANYHCFEVHYSGAGSIGQAITISIGNTTGTNTPIAPAPKPSSDTNPHTEATADTYPIIVKNFAAGANPNSATPVDSTTGRVAHIEAVRVTATVDPTIAFNITGIASGQTRCGISTSVTTGNLTVPFGAMSLNTFKTLAHQLTVSTNATSGYVVTASENDQLGKDGGTTPFIADTSCDSGPCTATTAQDWATATNNGFGYSLQNVDASSIAFQYNDSSRTFNAKQFPAAIESETPATLFSSTTVANAEDIYVCYRLSVGATQAAGDYENQITYTATGTF